MIREMKPEDIEEVMKINMECFNSEAWNRKAFEREFELDYSHKFVLEEHGNIVGYAVVWKVHDDASLMSIAVKKELWGRGYGRRLMEFLIEYLKGKVQRILLDVRKSNIRAIRLYQSLGFKMLSERSKYYSDGENALQMVLELEETDEHKRKTLETAHN